MYPNDAAIEALAAELINNHSRFQSFGWRTRPEDAQNWTIIYTAPRDAGCLARANSQVFRSALEPFRSEDEAGNEAGDARPESHGHWACGYVDGWSIRVRGADGQITDAFRAYAELELRRREYPSLDDDLLAQLESEEADDVWARCYRPAERVEYIRKNSEQFEFESLADMLACVRGKYFAGYASELVNR